MKTKYTVDYFINKFSAIPDENWALGMQEPTEIQQCALGHCGAQNSSGEGSIEAGELIFLIRTKLGVRAWEINDAMSEWYYHGSTNESLYHLGDTPKEIILTALELIKAGVSIE